MSLFDQLKRRNVIRTAIAYLALSWLLIQVAETLLPVYGYTDVAIRNLVAILLAGLVPVLVLSWTFEWTPQGLRRDAEVDRSGPVDSRANRLFDRIVVAVLVVAISYFSVDKFILDPARDAREIEAATRKAVTGAKIQSFGDKSIAVLAFDDMSPAGDQEYFSDGIAEEILNLLARIRELRVISRSTAFTFKGSTKTVKEIAEKLDVTYILEGSVRKSGDRVRITTQLIDARADAHLWSQTYDRTLDDIFAIQDEISAHVVDKLKLTLLKGVPKAAKVDPHAYDEYLQARYMIDIIAFNKFDADEIDKLEHAETLLNDALEIDPGFVAPLFELGRIYGIQGSTLGLLTRAEVRARRQSITDRVIEIDPTSAAAWFWRGFMAWKYENDMQAAARNFEQSMRADPTEIDHMRVIASFLVNTGHAEEAIAIGKYIVTRDPACTICVYGLSRAYRDTGRHAEAAEAFEDILRWRSPDASFYWNLGTMWLHAGHPDKALDAFRKEIDEGTREYAKMFALYDLGRMEEFEARFARQKEEAGAEDAEGVARIYAWMGDKDEAFAWLDKAIEARGSEVVDLIDTDYYEKIKSDPRWRALRDKYGYAADPVEDIEIEITLPPGVTID